MSHNPLVLAAAGAIDIGPNTNGLPGIAALENIVGALLTIALIASVAGLAISALVGSSEQVMPLLVVSVHVRGTLERTWLDEDPL